MLKRCLVLSICLLLGACSLWPSGDGDQSAPKTIGVISALTERIAVVDVNGGWSRQSAFYPVGNWQVDDLAIRQAGAWLTKHGYDVRPVTVAPGAFGAQALGGPVAKAGWADRPRPGFADLLHRNARPADLDYYLVLLEANGSTRITDMHGIGIVHFSGRPQAFIAYHMFLVDGKTGAIVDDVHADDESERMLGSEPIDSPYADLPKAVWPKQPADWSAEQQAAFRDGVETELPLTLKATLRRLDLP